MADIDQCDNGQFQSPIHIDSNNIIRCRNKCNLLFYYRGSRCNIFRDGKILYIEYDKGSHVIYNGEIYELNKISFTTPSSHRIDKTTGNMEVQLYHKAPDTGKVLILSIIYEINEASSKSKAFFDNFTYLIPKTNGDKHINMSSEWNIFYVLPEAKGFYTYEGSLINRPCSESITWIIFSQFANISDQSYRRISEIIGSNARKIQPLNNRTISYNSNTSSTNNINQSNPIICLTDKELQIKCNAMNNRQEKIDKTFGNAKILLSILTILSFFFIIVLVLLLKFGIIDKMITSIKNTTN